MKSNNKDHIKDIFASRLQNLEKEPPAFLWDNIEQELENSKNLIVSPQRHSLKSHFLLWGASIAAILILGLFFFMDNSDNSINILEDKAVSEVIKAVSVGTETLNKERITQSIPQNRIVADNRNITSQKKMIQSQESIFLDTISKGETKIILGIGNKQQGYSDNTEDNLIDDLHPLRENVESLDKPKNLDKEIADFENLGLINRELLANIDNSSSGSRGLSLGLNGGGTMSTADSYKRTLRAGLVNAEYMLRSQVIKYEHNQPISFGLSVNKKLTNRLSLESGLNYTYLSAKVRSGSDMSSYIKKEDLQYLHYLGVPLHLNYNLLEWKKLNIYFSLGGMIQKDIYGRYKRHDATILNGQTVYSESDINISQKNVQMSVDSSIGLSYPLYKGVSVYTTFGGSYYFDAKNEYETVFSDKKWLMNFNLGLKLGL